MRAPGHLAQLGWPHDAPARNDHAAAPGVGAGGSVLA